MKECGHHSVVYVCRQWRLCRRLSHRCCTGEEAGLCRAKHNVITDPRTDERRYGPESHSAVLTVAVSLPAVHQIPCSKWDTDSGFPPIVCAFYRLCAPLLPPQTVKLHKAPARNFCITKLHKNAFLFLYTKHSLPGLTAQNINNILYTSAITTSFSSLY